MYLIVKLDVHVFSKSAGVVIPECFGVSKSLAIQSEGDGQIEPNRRSWSFKLTMLIRFLTPNTTIMKMEEGGGSQG